MATSVLPVQPIITHTNNMEGRRNMGERRNSRKVNIEGSIAFVNASDCPSEVMCCRLSNDGKLIAVGLSNGVIKILTVSTMECAYSLHKSGPMSHLPVTSLRWRPAKDEQKFMLTAVYASGIILNWHVTTGKCTEVANEDRQCLSMDFNNVGSHFVVAGSDGKINMYDEQTGKCMSTFEASCNSETMDGHMMRVFAVRFSPQDQSIFVSGGWDDTVQWWDGRASDKHSVKKIHGPHICGEGISIEPSTLNMATASWRKDRNLQVWDFKSGNIIKDVPADITRSMYYCVEWKSRDSLVIGGSHQNVVRSVDYNSLQTSSRVLDLPGAVYSVDCRKQGNKCLVVAGTNKSVYVFEDHL